MKCEVCDDEESIGVACIPGVPMSVAYGAKCLAANAHPWWALVANTACMGGLEHANVVWVNMVLDTCRHLGKTIEDFKRDVAEAIKEMP